MTTHSVLTGLDRVVLRSTRRLLRETPAVPVARGLLRSGGYAAAVLRRTSSPAAGKA